MPKIVSKSDVAVSIPVRSTPETLASQGFHRFKKKNGQKNGQKINRILLEEFHQNFNSMTYLPYKKAKLYSAKGDITKEWYVEFAYQVPGSTTQKKRFKERFDINRIKNLSERFSYGKVLVDFINEKLAKGFNPFTANSKKEDGDFRVTTQLVRVVQQISRNASEVSKETYRDVYNRFMRFITSKKYESLFISTITIDHARSFKKWALYDQDLSVKTVNNSLSHLSMFFDEAIEMGLTMQNPFRVLPKAKKRDKDETGKDVRFEPFTNAEMELVFKWLKEKEYFDFINFLCVIYYAWARPIEILRLRICDIEMDRELIRFKANNTKNTNAAYVQIVPPLMKVFEKMNLSQYPTDYYLFSDGYKPGKRMFNKSNPSKFFRNTVKKELGVHKDMYALKHTGNIEYLLKNKGTTNLKWQQMQNRHSSSAITDRYNRKLGAYFIEVGEMKFRVFE